jgi:hypothetical protein
VGELPTYPHQTLNQIEDVHLKIQLWLTILQRLNHTKVINNFTIYYIKLFDI